MIWRQNRARQLPLLSNSPIWHHNQSKIRSPNRLRHSPQTFLIINNFDSHSNCNNVLGLTAGCLTLPCLCFPSCRSGINNLLQPPAVVTSIPSDAILTTTTSSENIEMHLSQAHTSATSGYETVQDFMPSGSHLPSDPTQYPLPPPSVTPTHTFFPPPQSQTTDPYSYSSSYSRQYDPSEMKQTSGFQSGGYSTSLYPQQYTPMDTGSSSSQKLVVNPPDVCFDQSGYRQMLGTMMNHLVPSGSQLCSSMGKETLRQRVPSMVVGGAGGRSSGSGGPVSRPPKVTNDVTAMKEKTPCAICGDVSAGFHCNAFVCEACKVS